MPEVSRWSASPTLLSACRAIPAAPRCISNSPDDAARGPRADTVPRAVALARVIDDARAGTAAGFAPPGRSRSRATVSAYLSHQRRQRPTHAPRLSSTPAAARRAVRPLVHRSAQVRCRQAGRLLGDVLADAEGASVMYPAEARTRATVSPRSAAALPIRCAVGARGVAARSITCAYTTHLLLS